MLSICTRLAVAAIIFVSFAGTALAEGYGLYEYSARGVALGGMVHARKPDPSAVAYNPALLTRLPGVQMMGGIATVSPRGKIDSTDQNGKKETTSLRKDDWVIPHLYYTHQISDVLTFGIGEFTRYGLGFEYPHNWPGRFSIYEVALKTFSINPNLALAVTDKLSLAAGVEVIRVDLDMKRRVKAEFGAENAMYMEVDSNIQEATDTTVGFNVAAHYQFDEQWAVGVLYRSQARAHAKGEVEYTLVDHNVPVPGMAEGAFEKTFRDGKAHSTVILPDSVSGGVSFTPVPELSFEVGATWTRWSTFRSLNIHLPDPIGESRSKKHWKDAWRVGVGIEYEPLDWLALRVGYAFDQSPMTERYGDYLVPTKDRHLWSVGSGFKWDSWTFDLAYCYIDARRKGYKASADTNTLKSRTHEGNATHVFTASLGYAF